MKKKIKEIKSVLAKSGGKEGKAAIYKIEGKSIEVKNLWADLLWKQKTCLGLSFVFGVI